MAFRTTPGSFVQVPVSPEIQMGRGAALQSGLSLLSNLTGPKQSSFAPIAQQARTQFETQTIPTLAERFTSLGGGAQRSSAFQGALGSAGAGLEQNLAALQSQRGLQERSLDQQLLSLLLSQGLQQPEQFYQQEQPGLLSGLGGGLGQSLPYLLPLLLGALTGGTGTAVASGGSALLPLLQNLFKG